MCGSWQVWIIQGSRTDWVGSSEIKLTDVASKSGQTVVKMYGKHTIGLCMSWAGMYCINKKNTS